MKKKKATASKLRRNDSVAGDIIFYEEKVRGKWGRWRVEAEKAGGKRPTFGNRDDAAKCALKWDTIYQQNRTLGNQIKRDVGDPVAATAALECERFNETENQPELSKVSQLNLTNSVTIAKDFLRTMMRINKARSQADRQSYSAQWMLQEFTNHCRENIIKEKQTVLFGQRIDEFIAFKFGPNGSKRNRGELQAESKDEWRGFIVNNLRVWIGNDRVAEVEELKPVLKKITNKIANKPTWGDTNKSKCAQKIKEFGAWLVDENYLQKNPFLRLRREFSYKTKKPIEVYTVKQVKEIFRRAVKGDPNAAKNAKPLHDLIPYLALTFFATTRPESDVFHTRYKTRQLTADQIRYDVDWSERYGDYGLSGATLIFKEFDDDGKRISKSSARQGVFFPNGIKWLKYWEKNFNNNQPFERVWYGRKPHDRLKKLIDFDWLDNGGRHTSVTACCMNFSWSGVHDFFAKAYGHSLDTQKSYYDNALMDTRSAKAYFAITPESVLK
ncbi:MAG: hypothetical protein ACJZ8W_06905 [Limisphaerales bacterium]